MAAGRDSGWPRWAGPAAVVGVALLARALEALLDPFVFNDGPRFVAMASAFLAGDWHTALADDFHPLTSLAMAAGSWAFGLDLEAAGETVSVLAGGVAALAVWKLALDQLGSRVALVAGLIFALHPRLRESSSGVQSDGLHLAFFALAALFAWRALELRQLGAAALAGLCTGLGYLTRPEALAVAVVMAGWLLGDLAQRRLSLGRAFSLGAAFGVSLAAVGAPYVLALHEIGGRWSITHKKDLTAWAALAAPEAAASAEPEAAAATEPVAEPAPAILPAPEPEAAPAAEAAPAPQAAPPAPEPRAAAAPEAVPPREPAQAAPAPPSPALQQTSRTALGELWRDGLRGFHPILLALAALGLGVIVRREPGARRAAAYSLSFLVLFIGLLLALHLLAGYVSRRHFLPAAALLVPLAGRGTLALSDALEGIPRLKAWRALPALGIAIVLGIFIEMLVPKGEPSKVARESAAQWLREHHAPTAVASHRARDAYYAGARWHVTLDASDDGVEAMLRSARARGAQFAILDIDPRSDRLLPAWAHVLHEEKYAGAEVLVLELAP